MQSVKRINLRSGLSAIPAVSWKEKSFAARLLQPSIRWANRDLLDPIRELIPESRGPEPMNVSSLKNFKKSGRSRTVPNASGRYRTPRPVLYYARKSEPQHRTNGDRPHWCVCATGDRPHWRTFRNHNPAEPVQQNRSDHQQHQHRFAPGIENKAGDQQETVGYSCRRSEKARKQ